MESLNRFGTTYRAVAVTEKLSAQNMLCDAGALTREWSWSVFEKEKICGKN